MSYIAEHWKQDTHVYEKIGTLGKKKLALNLVLSQQNIYRKYSLYYILSRKTKANILVKKLKL